MRRAAAYKDATALNGAEHADCGDLCVARIREKVLRFLQLKGLMLVWIDY